MLQSSYKQISIFDTAVDETRESPLPILDLSSTFIDNMKLPIHRWFRYSAGYSARWVEKTISDALIKQSIQNNKRDGFVVFDPFVGSGTTVLAAEQVGVQGVGFESHPLIAKVASIKLLWNTDIEAFRSFAEGVLESARSLNKQLDIYPTLIMRCYDEENLRMIDSLKAVINEKQNETNEVLLTWLAFVSILRSTSHAGTAQWQYVLPNKEKSRVQNVYDAFHKQVETMCGDMMVFASSALYTKGRILNQDARERCIGFDDTVDLVITSPPYANNYDYADATRLELCVLGEINGWADLQGFVRGSLVRSCSQQVSKEKSKTFDYIEDAILSPIHDELFEVCKQLEAERKFHGGKKNYHTMIALYFLDIAHVWHNLRKMCKNNSDICFVIGDSAPYGIYVPVDEWMGRLALSAGFESYEFVKTRDRNIKWKNRKHRVPLKEGQLWVKG